MFTGIIQAVGIIQTLQEKGGAVALRVATGKLPMSRVQLGDSVAAKGSITIDGVSSTVNHVDGCEFEINIVPHTLHETIIGSYQVGRSVNLEVDQIARYLERLLLGDKAVISSKEAIPSGVTKEFLSQNGYA